MVDPAGVGISFDSAGTHLQRYARSLRCAEINSSFYRPHAAATYAKWRDSTPPDFRFAVKMPRTITHELKLQDAREPLVAFLAQTDGLAQKRGPILVQLPPSLSFDATVVIPFLDLVRQVYDGPVVCEPRHATWFSPPVASLLEHTESHESRPIRHRCRQQPFPRAGRASPIFGCTAHHGSPGHDTTRTTSRRLRLTVRSIATAAEVWCVFDNTASGAAIENAWELRERRDRRTAAWFGNAIDGSDRVQAVRRAFPRGAR